MMSFVVCGCAIRSNFGGKVPIPHSVIARGIPLVHSELPEARRNTVKAFPCMFRGSAREWVFLEISSLFLPNKMLASLCKISNVASQPSLESR